jgi:hypothetical protein
MSENNILQQMADIVSTRTMDEFIRANEVMAFGEECVNSYRFMLCDRCGLTCVCSYVAPALVVNDSQEDEEVEEEADEESEEEEEEEDADATVMEQEDEDEDDEEDTSTSAYTTAPAAGSTTGPSAVTSTTSSAAITPAATAANTPGGTPASAARKACSECRRKHIKCDLPTVGAPCTGCRRARGGPATCAV